MIFEYTDSDDDKISIYVDPDDIGSLMVCVEDESSSEKPQQSVAVRIPMSDAHEMLNALIQAIG